MKFIKINTLSELDKIKSQKYSIIFVNDNYKSYLKDIYSTIIILDEKYSKKIFLITFDLIKENKNFKDITIFPSIFCFNKGEQNPKYFLNGLIEIKKYKEKIKNLQYDLGIL